jgi:hypothetical protein
MSRMKWLHRIMMWKKLILFSWAGNPTDRGSKVLDPTWILLCDIRETVAEMSRVPSPCGVWLGCEGRSGKAMQPPRSSACLPSSIPPRAASTPNKQIGNRRTLHRQKAVGIITGRSREQNLSLWHSAISDNLQIRLDSYCNAKRRTEKWWSQYKFQGKSIG